MAINWAVGSFVVVVLFVIALALPPQITISFSNGLILTSVFALILHGSVVFGLSRSKRWQRIRTAGDGTGVVALEYTVSVVCVVLYFTLWWYGALDAMAIFLLVPTYFATSLVTYHVLFAYLAQREIHKLTLLLLAGNAWTLAHYIVIMLQIREKIEHP